MPTKIALFAHRVFKLRPLYIHRVMNFSNSATNCGAPASKSSMPQRDVHLDMQNGNFSNCAPFNATNNFSHLDAYLTQLKSAEQSRKFHEILLETVDLIDETIRKFEPNRWCLAFNGGKDCTALLHLVICRLCKNYGESGHKKLRAFYFQSGRPFPDVDQFVEETKNRYNIHVITLKGSVKQACFDLKSSHPEIEAVFMGTRHCDFLHAKRRQSNGKLVEAPPTDQSETSTSNLDLISKTDADWPEFLRVCPILKWDYCRIWHFLLDLHVPYCSLYDQGYTSLGDYGDTVRNPALLYTDKDGSVKYRPAYQLADGTLERASRLS